MRDLRYATILMAAFVAGCIPQRERAAAQQSAACAAAVYNSPDAAILRQKESFRPNEATLAQLSDPSLATDQERAAIAAVHQRGRTCTNYLINQTAALMPSLAPILSGARNEAEDNTIALEQRRITWGEYNKRRRDLALALQQDLLAEQRRLNAENSARMEANRAAAQREAVIDALTAPRPAPPAPAPVMMSCQPNGNGFDCLSP